MQRSDMERMRRKRSYKRQLLSYFAAVFVIFAILLILFQFRSDMNNRKTMLQDRLSCYADIIAQSEDYAATVALFPPELRVTVIDKDGKVIYDSVEDEDLMDNHGTRPEVKAAAKDKEGGSIRKSDTVGINYFYYAKSYGGYTVRMALPFEYDVKKALRPDSVFILIVVLVFLVALFFIIFLSDKFGEGVTRLHSFAEAAEQGKVDYENMSFPDSELGDIGKQMLESYHRLEQSNQIIALEKERLLLHLHYYEGGIAIFSQERRKVYANAKFVQFVNLMLDRPTPDLDSLWDSEIFRPITEFVERNTDSRVENVPVFQYNVGKGGRVYVLQVLVYPDNGCEVSVNDVTDIEKNRVTKQQMTNNIAHELRTPVSSIRGYLETLTVCKDISAEKRNMFLDRAYVQVMRLSDLIRDIGMITKIEEAPEQLHKEKINLKNVFDEVTDELRPRIEDMGILVENALAPDLVVNGNPSLIYAVFRNLMENSLKYAGKEIKIHVECYARGDGYCHFSYYDTGKGVPEEHLSKIFERFYRVSEGRTRDDGGSGLGLSIVRNAIAFHKGDVRALNRKGGGLEFLFSLSEK